MNALVAIDTWIVEQIFQRIVNAAWAHLGISRKGLCRAMTLVWVCARIADRHTITNLIIMAFLLWLTLAVVENSPMSSTGTSNSILRTFCIPLYAVGLTGVLDAVGSAAFLATYYLCACQDPPPRKRKNWKATLDKLSSQWTWIPARQGA